MPNTPYTVKNRERERESNVPLSTPNFERKSRYIVRYGWLFLIDFCLVVCIVIRGGKLVMDHGPHSFFTIKLSPNYY
jgi:hypothetical protein